MAGGGAAGRLSPLRLRTAAYLQPGLYIAEISPGGYLGRVLFRLHRPDPAGESTPAGVGISTPKPEAMQRQEWTMLRNYLRVAWRCLVRHKGYSAINIFGLAIGMACSLLIMLWVRDESAMTGSIRTAGTSTGSSP